MRNTKEQKKEVLLMMKQLKNQRDLVEESSDINLSQYAVFDKVGFRVDLNDYRLMPLEGFELPKYYYEPLYLYDIPTEDFQNILDVLSLEEQELLINLTIKAVRHSNIMRDKHVKQ